MNFKYTFAFVLLLILIDYAQLNKFNENACYKPSKNKLNALK